MGEKHPVKAWPQLQADHLAPAGLHSLILQSFTKGSKDYEISILLQEPHLKLLV